MKRTIYQNNDVEILSVDVDFGECKINCNGANLIWISEEQEDEFKRELSELLDRYRI